MGIFQWPHCNRKDKNRQDTELWHCGSISEAEAKEECGGRQVV